MVALQMLKARWLKMHQSQAAGEFCYNTLYDTEKIVADTAVSVRILRPPRSWIPWRRTVYQYPGMEKQKQFQEKSMDVHSLELEYLACCDDNCTYRYEGLL